MPTNAYGLKLQCHRSSSSSAEPLLLASNASQQLITLNARSYKTVKLDSPTAL
jgi:hypothetical protein